MQSGESKEEEVIGEGKGELCMCVISSFLSDVLSACDS